VSTYRGIRIRLAHQQQSPGDAQAAINVEGPVEAGIVDEALPSNRCPRLFEIYAHDDLEFAVEATAQVLETVCILERCIGVVHRAGTDDDKKSIIIACKNTMYGLACPRDGIGRSTATGKFTDHGCGRAEFVKCDNAEVVGGHHHGVVSSRFSHTVGNKKAARWLAAAGLD